MPKAKYRYDGDRLVDRAVRTVREGGCERVLVVLGAFVCEVPDAEVIHNPKWHSGLASSLSAGLSYLAGLESVDRVIITLVDEPNIAPADIQRLLASTSPLAATLYGNQWSHPILIHSSHWNPLQETLVGDRGARAYLMAHKDQLTLYQTSNLAGLADLDYIPEPPLQARNRTTMDRTVQDGQ